MRSREDFPMNNVRRLVRKMDDAIELRFDEQCSHLDVILEIHLHKTKIC